ncbi:helix-turn-helix domain-containing protein [Bacteroides sp.]|uniref:helix-turn-helix domain-containing protein n=1 Tax=Bacteroides sp. TaxID=29523 RepID=UPI00262AF207|nr:helix-turn-helix domain-containing protein [Bacteroides sp.]MDD3037792.1 helix-turn-helix domain-containing protein [Bacteroides sp.]
MKKIIPQFKFYKYKYGSELLVDVIELKNIKKFLTKNPTHTLTYYDITFITEGGGNFSIDNQFYIAKPYDVFFSRPGEIRNWDTNHIVNGYALIFEDGFLSSLFKDALFVQHLSFFCSGKVSAQLCLSSELYIRIIQVLHHIKIEINSYKQSGVEVLRALLYEVLMLLDRAYLCDIQTKSENKEMNQTHANKFVELVGLYLEEQHSVRYYADKLCITPNYLNEIANLALGVSAKQYIQNKVMDEAKKILVYTNLSILEIAYYLHFSSVSYFTRCFRQYTGETPSSYRNIHKP